jgi:hypothetical protein
MTRTGPLTTFLFSACCLLLVVGAYSDAQYGMFLRAALLGGCVAALPVVAFLQRHKPPSAKKPRDPSYTPTENMHAMVDRYTTDEMAVFLVAAFFASWSFWVPFAEFLYVSAVYGHDAWVSGLHVINKQGELSNGDKMSERACVLVFFGSFVVMMATWLGSVSAAAYLAMGFHRERLSDQLELYRRSLQASPK